MSDRRSKRLTPYAQKLRRDMTPEEKKLWYQCLKVLPIPVYRQRVIENYIVDFYCANPKTVIEIDGSQHYEEKGLAEDAARDAFMRENEITVLRYSNADVNQRFASVCEDIWNHLVAGVQR